MLEPEVYRQKARLTTRLGRREQEDPHPCCRRQHIDLRVLPIGRDDAFQLAPELIHRIEFRRLLRQPQELDVEVGRQRLRLTIGVAAGPIHEQPDRALGAVAPPQLGEERPHVGTTSSRANEHEAMAGAHIDRAEEHALALVPMIGTTAVIPTGAYVARSDGKNRSNVQPVNNTMSPVKLNALTY